MRRFRNPGLVTASIAMLALAGCASTGSPAASTNVTGSTAPSATTSPSSPASVAPSAPTSSKPSVDLTLTGVLSAVAKGTAGRCTLTKDAAGNVVFGFEATAADYPDLVAPFFVDEGPAGYLIIRWAAGPNFQSPLPYGHAISADHHSVTLDTVITGNGGMEQVKGTISCP